MTDYLEGDVSPGERSRIEAALAEHPELRDELRELEATVALLRGLSAPEPPPALAARVMERVRAGEAEAASWWAWLRKLGEPAVALPLAAGVAALTLFIGSQGGVLPGSDSQGGPAPGVQTAATRVPAPVRATPQRSTAAVVTPEDAARSRLQLAHKMRRLDRMQQLARGGRTEEAARILRGAGHPYSASFAAQLEPDRNLALVSYPGGR
jgi:anti-sigma factor RsiW